MSLSPNRSDAEKNYTMCICIVDIFSIQCIWLHRNHIWSVDLWWFDCSCWDLQLQNEIWFRYFECVMITCRNEKRNSKRNATQMYLSKVEIALWISKSIRCKTSMMMMRPQYGFCCSILTHIGVGWVFFTAVIIRLLWPIAWFFFLHSFHQHPSMSFCKSSPAILIS